MKKIKTKTYNEYIFESFEVKTNAERLRHQRLPKSLEREQRKRGLCNHQSH